MLLAIDTATRHASLALYDEAGVTVEATWRARENHTTSLMPELVRLMALSGAQVESVRAVAVATGPGSFTGLRIGMSVAKGLALGRGLPLIGVPTLDGLAHAMVQFSQAGSAIWAVLQAGRGRYAAGRYVVRDGRAQREGDYAVGDAQTLAREIASQLAISQNGEGADARENVSSWSARRILVCGEVDAALRATLLAKLEDRVVLTDPAMNVRRASYLAELAWTKWQTDSVDDVESLAPYYIPTATLATPAQTLSETGHDD